jgi:hypothetical protein
MDSPLLADAHDRSYAFAPTLHVVEYVKRFVALVATLSFAVGPAAVVTSSVDRLPLAACGLVVQGFALLFWWRAGHRGIVWMVALTVLILPIAVVSRSYRYFYGVLPLLDVAIGALAVEAARDLRGMSSRFGDTLPWWSRVTPTWRRVTTGGVLVLVAVMIASPLLTVPLYYRRLAAAGQTNETYATLVAIVREHGACGDGLRIDLHDPASVGDPAPRTAQALRVALYTLTMDGCPPVRLTDAQLADDLARAGWSGWLIASEGQAALLSARVQIEPVAAVSPWVTERAARLVFARIRRRE